MKKYLVFSLTFFLTVLCQGQISEGSPKIYSFFDREVGLENTGLLNGLEYIEEHNTVNEKHKYFITTSFSTGSVIYEGLPYYNVNLKYNIWDDVLLAKVQKSGGEAILELHKEKIDRFSIDGHEFINLLNAGEKRDLNGFHEILLENSTYTLVKDHKKKLTRKTDGRFVYFEFENRNSDYYFEYKDSYYPLTSRRSLSKILPDKEKEIRDYYRTHSSVLKNNPDVFFTNLFKDLTNSSSLTTLQQ